MKCNANAPRPIPKGIFPPPPPPPPKRIYKECFWGNMVLQNKKEIDDWSNSHKKRGRQ